MTKTPAIVPAPREINVPSAAPFVLTAATAIRHDAAAAPAAAWLSRWLGLKAGAAGPGPAISISVDPALAGEVGGEGYRLSAGAGGVAIRAAAPAGAFYGVQTLRQLLPPDIEQSGLRAQNGRMEVPAVEISDAPRFGWRGAMLDVSRHFASVAEVKRFIDLMALHKLNVFHWHLVDDQGWRIEIKKYPRLTEIGAWRAETPRRDEEGRGDGVPHGGFYTQEEIRAVVAYAAERFITVVPEIELPGHSSAALAAYPHLGNTDVPEYQPMVRCHWGIIMETYAPKPETFQFLDDVFTEVLQLFPGTFVHIGGDEAMKDQWEKSAHAQAFMKANGLKDAHELQSHFVRRTEKFLADRGRRLIGWDEIQEGGLAPGAAMMAWRDVKWAVQAARMVHDVVMAPHTHTYFNFTESNTGGDEDRWGMETSLEKAYSYEPIPEDLEPAHHARVLGGQGQLWREDIPGWARLEYMTFPRLTALSEVLWSPAKRKDFADFRERLRRILARFDRMGVGYRRSALPTKEKAG